MVNTRVAFTLIPLFSLFLMQGLCKAIRHPDELARSLIAFSLSLGGATTINQIECSGTAGQSKVN